MQNKICNIHDIVYRADAEGGKPWLLFVNPANTGARTNLTVRISTDDGKTWTKTVKPRPAEMDEWTHYLYDASGNPVSHDLLVAPPGRLQWVGSPRWARHHDHMASMSALVSASGRIFYIIDEGPKASILLPPKWFLVARDAFSGVVLWKRPIRSWYVHLWPLKSGPAHLPRRLVAVGDRVYVTLGLDAPVSELDAATGRTIRSYEATASTEELILSDGVLFALLAEPVIKRKPYSPIFTYCWSETSRANRQWAWQQQQKRSIVAVETRTGKVLWSRQYPVAPLTLAADMMMKQGARSVRACATHPVLSGGAYEKIENSSLIEVVVTDSIPLKQQSKKIRVISIADLMADIIQKVYTYQSISTRFLQ